MPAGTRVFPSTRVFPKLRAEEEFPILRVASGEWRVASGEWRVASGEWRGRVGARTRTTESRPSTFDPRLESCDSRLETPHQQLSQLRGPKGPYGPGQVDRRSERSGKYPVHGIRSSDGPSDTDARVNEMNELERRPQLRPTIYAPLRPDVTTPRPQALPVVSGTRADSSPEYERLAAGTLGPLSPGPQVGSLNWV